jgi:hypothetical protein
MRDIDLDGVVIDNTAEGLLRVHRRVFTDPDMLELERQRVFAHSWIDAGHGSEIPQPGDFRARHVYRVQGFRHLTLEDIERTERACFGAPEEVRESLVDLADSLGANTLRLNFNQGALPHERLVQNLRRFAKEVLPALKAPEVTTVPVH